MIVHFSHIQPVVAAEHGGFTEKSKQCHGQTVITPSKKQSKVLTIPSTYTTPGPFSSIIGTQ